MPNELSPAELDAIRRRNDNHIRCRTNPSRIHTKDIPALLSHADALAAKVAHAESRWQKDAMQIDTDMDDLREERDEALAKVATLQSLCDSLKAKAARLEREREFVRNLETSGGDLEHGITYVRISPRGCKVSCLFGDVIDWAYAPGEEAE